MISDRARAVVVLGVLALGLMAPDAASAVCVLTCPADVTENVTTISDSIVVNYLVSGNADCTGVTQTSGLPTGSSFPGGTTTNSFMGAPNGATCQFDVVVLPVGRGAPALGGLGLSVLAAILAGLGIWSARRRPRTV